MVSFCDHVLSVVQCAFRCPSVINNFFEHLLLSTHKASCNQTLQECSLDEALSKMFKEFNSMKNSGCPSNKKGKFGKILKILSETMRPRATKFGMQVHLVDLYQDCSNYSPAVKNGPSLWVSSFT